MGNSSERPGYYILLCLLLVVFQGCVNSSNSKTNEGLGKDSIVKSTNITTNPGNGTGTIIGKVYDYVPETGIANLPTLKGYLLSSATEFDIKGNEDYGITLFIKGTANMVMIDSCLRNDSGHVLGYKIIDTLFVPFVPDSETLDYSNCYHDTVPANNLIALFKIPNLETWTNALKAWRIDTIALKFRATDTSHIRLYMPGDDDSPE
jgi:hypothetical protein